MGIIYLKKVPLEPNESSRQGGVTEMVLVPRIPTKEMLDAAFWAAHEEDAELVWERMVDRWLLDQKGKL